jgi:hypothetical protein
MIASCGAGDRACETASRVGSSRISTTSSATERSGALSLPGSFPSTAVADLSLHQASESEMDKELDQLQRENKLIASAWYDLTCRLQSNTVLLARRAEGGRSWLGRMRTAVNRNTSAGGQAGSGSSVGFLPHLSRALRVPITKCTSANDSLSETMNALLNGNREETYTM